MLKPGNGIEGGILLGLCLQKEKFEDGGFRKRPQPHMCRKQKEFELGAAIEFYSQKIQN